MNGNGDDFDLDDEDFAYWEETSQGRTLKSSNPSSEYSVPSRAPWQRNQGGPSVARKELGDPVPTEVQPRSFPETSPVDAASEEIAHSEEGFIEELEAIDLGVSSEEAYSFFAELPNEFEPPEADDFDLECDVDELDVSAIPKSSSAEPRVLDPFDLDDDFEQDVGYSLSDLFDDEADDESGSDAALSHATRAKLHARQCLEEFDWDDEYLPTLFELFEVSRSFGATKRVLRGLYRNQVNPQDLPVIWELCQIWRASERLSSYAYLQPARAEESGRLVFGSLTYELAQRVVELLPDDLTAEDHFDLLDAAFDEWISTSKYREHLVFTDYLEALLDNPYCLIRGDYQATQGYYREDAWEACSDNGVYATAIQSVNLSFNDLDINPDSGDLVLSGAFSTSDAGVRTSWLDPKRREQREIDAIKLREQRKAFDDALSGLSAGPRLPRMDDDARRRLQARRSRDAIWCEETNNRTQKAITAERFAASQALKTELPQVEAEKRTRQSGRPEILKRRKRTAIEQSRPNRLGAKLSYAERKAEADRRRAVWWEQRGNKDRE